MRRIAGVALGVTTLVVGTLAGSTASSATPSGPTQTPRTGASDSGSWPPWIPYEQEDVTYPAGVYCEFEVFAEVLRDREFFRDVTTYPDGSPRIQLWRGPLVLRFTNTETGFSVDRNASGRAFMEYGPDEEFQAITIQAGHFVGGMRAGSDPSQGIFYTSGRWSTLVRHADGRSTLRPGPNGATENLCDTLDR